MTLLSAKFSRYFTVQFRITLFKRFVPNYNFHPHGTDFLKRQQDFFVMQRYIFLTKFNVFTNEMEITLSIDFLSNQFSSRTITC